MPIDVEERGVRGRLAVLEEILPPGVVAASDPHVVRHHVEQQPHPPRAERRDQSVERRLAAELRIDDRGVDDVVAVAAAGLGA
ncbi:MAG: hypothetical protein AVDCRST_MAG19-2463, partial [uncultured Thermomicrobiales bacterium]